MGIQLNTYRSQPDGSRRVDYSTLGSEGYAVQDVTFDDPSTRPLKVIAIGCGVSTILNLYYIQKHVKHVEVVAYDKNAKLGGTWTENRYPGVACDVPAHGYAFPFAPKPDWPRLIASAPEIQAYLEDVCDVFDLKKYMRLEHEVLGAYWQNDTAKWMLKIRKTTASGQHEEFEDTCDLLLYNKGTLNTFKWPKVPGLDKFKGKVIHTAQWPGDYQSEQWEKERIAVIGSGASSIQVVPKLQAHAKNVDVFIRTGVWFIQISEQLAQEYEYTEEEKEGFRNDPDKAVAHAKGLDQFMNRLMPAFYKGSPAAQFLRQTFQERMGKFIKDERLLKGFLPDFGLGCRRVTPGDPYMEAIQQPNVDVHFTGVAAVRESTIIGDDGSETEVDTIIAATGFDTSYVPPFPVIGRNGVDLREEWREEPNAYFGVAAPSMPNLIMSTGPAWPVINGSVTSSLETNALYAVQVLQKMQKDWIKSWVPKQAVIDRFNQHVQEWCKSTVWSDSCRSWYKNNDTGRVNAVWPGSALHFRAVLASPRWEDMEIEYQHENLFAHLGMGYAKEDRDLDNHDLSPYYNRDAIDPTWLAAIQKDSNTKHIAGVSANGGNITDGTGPDTEKS